jgi:hypothetical protein
MTAAPQPEGEREILVLAWPGDACVLQPAVGAALESAPAQSLDASLAAAWLQRHAVERVEITAAADRGVADLFSTQARRLGIAIANAGIEMSAATEPLTKLARPAEVAR